MSNILSASSITSDKVANLAGEELGKVEDLMINLASGRVEYAVLSFGGGFMHGGKFFAIPWKSFAVDQLDKKLILNIPREKLESAQGFDKDHWPDMADPSFITMTHEHYGVTPS